MQEIVILNAIVKDVESFFEASSEEKTRFLFRLANIIAVEIIGNKFILYCENPHCLITIPKLWNYLSANIEGEFQKLIAVGIYSEKKDKERSIRKVTLLPSLNEYALKNGV